jgi:hypothetical protein
MTVMSTTFYFTALSLSHRHESEPELRDSIGSLFTAVSPMLDWELRGYSINICGMNESLGLWGVQRRHSSQS